MSNRDLLKQFVDGAPLTPAGISHLIECHLLTKTDKGSIRLTTGGSLLLGTRPYFSYDSDSASCPDEEQQHMRNMEPVYSESDPLTRNPGEWVEVGTEDLFNRQVRARLDAVTAVPSLLTGESDPHGKHQHETGAKLDAGKPRLGLVLGAFANALVEVGKVGTYGAQKYTDNGWLDVPKGKARYTDALLRHIFAETNETHDPDTLLLHAAHAAWNALARLELILRKRGDE